MILRDLQLFLPVFLLAPFVLSADQHIAFSGDALYLRKAGGRDHRLVLDLVNGEYNTAIDAGTLDKDSGFQPGYRVGMQWVVDKKNSLEASFFQIDEWSAHSSFSDPGNLSFPFDDPSYTEDYTSANSATVKYTTRLDNGELNFWRHLTPRNEDYASLSGLIGLRYIAIQDTLKIAFTTASDTSNYNLYAKNQLAGGQIGFNLQFNPTTKFFWELIGKVGGYLNQARQHQVLNDVNNTEALRGGSGRSDKAGLLLEGDATFGFHFGPHLDFHVGYTGLYLTNVALAPDQINHSSSVVDNVKTIGDQVYHGLVAGLLLSF